MSEHLEDIAAKAGVSIATASRALNGKGGVKEETRQRVLAIAQELHYSASMTGRGLATSRTQTICYAINQQHDSFEDPFYPIIMHGIEAELRKHDYHLLLTAIDNGASKSLTEFRPVVEGRVDGVILAGPDIPPRLIVDLHQRKIPLILVDNDLAALSIDTINSDNVQGGRIATEHLIQHGHHTIVSLLGPDSWHSSLQRERGYQEAMTAAHLTPRAFHVEATTTAMGRIAITKALEAEPDLTAVFAVNDAMAIGAIHELTQLGRRVPEDVAVIGFDDIAFSALLIPALTTVRVFTREIGRLAALRMLDILETQDSSAQTTVRTLLRTELIPRRSCGCDYSPNDRSDKD